MSKASSQNARIRVDGKFFRRGERKFYLKGVTYGPFVPRDDGSLFAGPEQTAADFALLRQLDANVLRIYVVPPKWFLDLAMANELMVLVDIPWNKQRCFLDAPEERAVVVQTVRQAAEACARHPAVFALSVVNEIPPDVVRWSGAGPIAAFIDELVGVVKAVDPECLVTFGNFPPTEFRPTDIDFHCVNVYLHQPRALENYLARLQTIADAKPLILGECGIDSLRAGEARQAEMLAWQVETAFRSGLAGFIWYSFCDEWFKEGRAIDNWRFGLVSRERVPKAAFEVARRLFEAAPHFPLPHYPMVSVVVASYNAARTLPACLDSLARLNYPLYEVLLVDDGSTDGTAEIARRFTNVRYLRHPENLGLSTARNTGIAAAQGEIIAFTDADCRADEDWLYYLVGDLLHSALAAIGGHNLLPRDDSWVAAAVMVSPGGPAHVMLTDRVAEHIPGCNMAFFRWALEEIGGFDPIFRQAGDDVDVCWRLQQRGLSIGFSHAGFVWHHRRSTANDYLKQQHGYGEAEALLVRKHPEYFNGFGGSVWRGRIYSPAKFGLVFRRPRIYFGPLGYGMFQSLYAAEPAHALMWITSLEYHVLVTVPLLALSPSFHFLFPLAVVSGLASAGVCVLAAVQAEIPHQQRRLGSRPLVAGLFWLQPIVRGWARYQGRLSLPPAPLAARETLDSLSLRDQKLRFDETRYWTASGDRLPFLRAVLQRLEQDGWPHKPDIGWSHYDVEIIGSRWSHLRLTTVLEAPPNGPYLIRCRLQAVWTLLAWVTFWVVLGVEMVVLGLLGWWLKGLWLPLASAALMSWWLRRQKRDLRRLIAVFLDATAERLGLTKA